MLVAKELKEKLEAGHYSNIIEKVEALELPNEELSADIWLLYYIAKYKAQELPKESWKVGNKNNPALLDRKRYVNELSFWHTIQSNPEEAINIIKETPTNLYTPELQARLGTCYMLLGRHDEAKPWLEQAHSQDPTNEDILNNYASCSYRLGELENALQLYKLCIELNPDNIGAKSARDKLIAGTEDADKLTEELKNEYRQH